MESYLFGFIEGQNHFSTSWHAIMNLTLKEPIMNCASFRAPNMHQKAFPNMERCCMQNNQLSTKGPVDLKDNSNITTKYLLIQIFGEVCRKCVCRAYSEPLGLSRVKTLEGPCA